MGVLTTGVKPESKHNLPNQLSGSRFPTTYAGTFVPGLGRLDGWGTTVPTDGDTGWAKAALFRHTDGSGGDDLIYQNNGTLTSCAFIEITSVAGADFGATGIKGDNVLESTTGSGVTLASATKFDSEGEIRQAGYSDMSHRNRVRIVEDFLLDAGGTLPPPWGKNVETANITGDYGADSANGEYIILTDSTSEAQSGQLFFSDQLVVDITKNPVLEVRLKIAPAGTEFTADERLVVGLCPAHTNAETALDNIDHSVWFKLEGADLKIYVEADDASTDTDDQDSTIVYVKNTYLTLRIDLSTLTAIGFYVDGVEQGGAAVTAASLTGNVQPIICHQRDAGAEVNTITIDYVSIEYDRE